MARKRVHIIPLDLPQQLKIKRLTSEQKWLWVVILLLAHRSPVPNQLYIDQDIPINEQDLANEASIPIETLHKHLAEITALNMLVKEHGVFQVLDYKVPTTSNSQIQNIKSEQSEGSNTAEELEIAQSMGYTLEEWLDLKNQNN